MLDPVAMPRVNVTIPVLNEEAQLDQSIHTLERFLQAHTTFEFRVVIADNGSTDRTLALAQQLKYEFANLEVVHLDQRGRGRALQRVWSESTADILSYMDVDLSTDLKDFPPLIASLASGDFDLAIGSRLHTDARVTRSLRRELISRGYNRLLKCLFAVRFSDAQCGFKAITRQAAMRLLPVIEDTGWFFDTELLLVAEECGYRICNVPVTWIDDPDSRVRVLSTAWADVKGLRRVRRNLRHGVYANLTRGANITPLETAA
jgi:glycosyltransferase involved in cell wall biosynthesis